MDTPTKRKPGRPKKPGGPGKQFSIRLSESERQRLRQASTTTNRSVNWLISACVRNALQKVCMDAMEENSRLLREAQLEWESNAQALQDLVK